MVIMDVDGVLTDGRIIFDSRGVECKSFDVHDGFALERGARKGLLFAIVSGRKSECVTMRAKELGIDEVYQGQKDKLKILGKLKVRYHLRDDEICFIGDDEPDLSALNSAGVSAAPANAVYTVRNIVDIVTAKEGGRGAVREVIDMILNAKHLL